MYMLGGFCGSTGKGPALARQSASLGLVPPEPHLYSPAPAASVQKEDRILKK